MDLTETVPDADAFRALARSSPWRWSTLRLRHHERGRTVEAWVRRPGWLRTVDEHGELIEQGVPYTRTAMTLGGPAIAKPRDPEPWVPLHPQDVVPTYRPDGLVAVRPDADYDDPIYRTYQWVAMLDPVELSAGVAYDDLALVSRRGRPTWEASARAHDGYEPRCGGGCCELLFSEASWRAERQDDPPDDDWPDHHRVALDVETGVVVHLSAVGGRPEGRDAGFDVEILEVDAPVDA